jgi:hypothetical protein
MHQEEPEKKKARIGKEARIERAERKKKKKKRKTPTLLSHPARRQP